jgi:hypothetical protein
MAQQILTLTRDYQPHRWVDQQEAIFLQATGDVIDNLGDKIIVYHGGTNAKSGLRSIVETSTIIVESGMPHGRLLKDPALTNPALFQRDRFTCAYCASIFTAGMLTRDHIVPTSKGGKDRWGNVVTACRPCNGMKGDLMPGQKLPKGQYSPQGTFTMDPIYVPYAPCKAEAMILKNRSILADQMKFLLEAIKDKKNSRIYKEMSDVQAVEQ